jgi:hypothetical protein
MPTRFCEIATPHSLSPLCRICAVIFNRTSTYGAKAFRVGREVNGGEVRMADHLRTIEVKLALSKTLQTLRAAQELSQVDAARRLESSQSRVAKMEASHPSVSVDLFVRSLFKLGVQPGDIAKALRPRRRVAAT